MYVLVVHNTALLPDRKWFFRENHLSNQGSWDGSIHSIVGRWIHHWFEFGKRILKNSQFLTFIKIKRLRKFFVLVPCTLKSIIIQFQTYLALRMKQTGIQLLAMVWKLKTKYCKKSIFWSMTLFFRENHKTINSDKKYPGSQNKAI